MRYTFVKLITIGSMLVALPVQAAEPPVVSLDLPNSVINIGTIFEARVLVKSSVPLNAYRLGLVYDPAALKLLGFVNARSIINIWQKGDPAVNSVGQISLNGGSLAPFTGEQGEIMTLRFEALKAGRTALRFKIASGYLADGKATPVNFAGYDAVFTVSSAKATSSEVQTALPPATPDHSPPEVKLLTFSRDPFNSNQQLLTFVVSDQESGIKSTAVRFKSWLGWSDWQSAQSPMPVTSNVWAVELKASNYAGEETDQTLADFGAILARWQSVIALIIVIILGLIVINTIKRAKKSYNNI